MSRATPRLLLGPILRHVGETHATIWVETDRPCEVGVLGSASRTFTVAGHHYALVVVSGLARGSATPYEVSLDGQRVWPEAGSPYPASVVRTLAGGRPLRIAWGSCRATSPHHPPYTWARNRHPAGRETDALWAFAEQLWRGRRSDLPDLLLMAGDQVYADENVSPGTVEFIRSRRDVTRPPGEEVADFAEYCTLYAEAWGEPTIRWLLSTVPSVMIFDDHDVNDDWNTSAAWRARMATLPWWPGRLQSALMSYWIYQHLGNLAPAELERDEIYARLRRLGPGEDGEAVLRAFAERAEVEADGRKHARWSVERHLGGTRMVVIDSRAGRIVEGDHRDMLDEDEWRWVDERLTGDLDHLLVVTSLPYLLPPALHHLEAWNEAVCHGAWGRRWARRGERIRQDLDLEHWAAFEGSFHRLAGALREVAEGRRGRPPATITLLSGDVHFSYVARAAVGEHGGVAVHQVVCSPLRNALPTWLRRAAPLARFRPLAALVRGLAATARAARPPVRWRIVDGPWFDNSLCSVRIDGRELRVAFDVAPPGDGQPVLDRRLDRRLS